jgi:hypothetical protein
MIVVNMNFRLDFSAQIWVQGFQVDYTKPVAIYDLMSLLKCGQIITVVIQDSIWHGPDHSSMTRHKPHTKTRNGLSKTKLAKSLILRH